MLKLKEKQIMKVKKKRVRGKRTQPVASSRWRSEISDDRSDARR